VRLVHIKLAGFKSFVDPTTIKTPSQLVGVVGPNGCGKSNIIDAVRWVLGESRASELRGDSMHDVIFNGSEARAPAARASVELIFTNTGQRLLGQWGAYSELAVRRTLARDEGSRYYINNQQVRRRDIYDIFMGTGLATRGYAIIGQGMISRLIEARPEELRVYLEEAAGVSRYKERRRETENRLRDTHENLTRLEDLLEEIAAQRKRLERQAAQARRYQDLQQQGQHTQHALWRFEQQQAQIEQQQHQEKIQQLQLTIEQHNSKLRSVQTQLIEQRVHYEQINEAVQAAQAALYEANSQVSSAQAELRFIEANQKRSVQRRRQIEQQLEHWQSQQEQAQSQVSSLEADRQQALEQYEEHCAQVEHVEIELEAAEQRLQDEHAQRDELRAQLQRDEQQLALVQQRFDDAHRQVEQLKTRQQQLHAQQNKEGADAPLAQDDLTHLAGAHAQSQQQHQALQDELIELEARLPKKQAELEAAEHAWHEQQKKQTVLAERIRMLEQLQQQWSSPVAQQQWLDEQGLSALRQLWPLIQVEQGWETAIEALLREEITTLLWSEAQLQPLQKLNLQPPQRVSIGWPTVLEDSFPAPRDTAAGSARHGLSAWQGCPPLLQMLHTEHEAVQSFLELLLAQVWVVDDWAQGLALATKLPVTGQLIHPEGHIFKPYGVCIYAPHDEQAGALARQQELRQLKQSAQIEQVHTEQAARQRQAIHESVQSLQQRLQQVRTRVHELGAQMHQLELQQAQVQQQKNQYEQEQAYLRAELTRIDEQLATIEQEQAQRMLEREEGEAIVEELRARFVAIDERCVDLGQQVRDLRLQLRGFEQAMHQRQQEQNTLGERLRALQDSHAQAQAQQQSLSTELGQLQNELLGLEPEAAQEVLDLALTRRDHCEEQWQQAQAQLKTQHEALQALEQKEARQAQGIGPLKEQIAALQLKEQAARLRAEQYSAQLLDKEVELETLDQFIAQQSANWQDKKWLNDEIKRIQQAIEAMGAVNLAALQELENTKEREQYLLAQQDDLLTAIETLENAIRKIDRETRSLLWDTFEQVNQHFSTLFPQLFGGGQAKLVLLGDEVLEAGVQVQAQPPGKRNTTIALLSGGEKALTATALVFAFFKLNPAPFCLLDEVDAPLDDANAERYANLVRAMSDETQFLFVTHNKITMQAAEQLIGVTMQEQGVSRIVSVDIQAATELAEA